LVESPDWTLRPQVLPARFAQLERLVPGPFFCGARLTTADLSFYVMARGFADGTFCAGVSKTLLEKCPKLQRLVAAVEDHPRVQSWAAHRKALESAA
jgi:glutathione S-transferase